MEQGVRNCSCDVSNCTCDTPLFIHLTFVSHMKSMCVTSEKRHGCRVWKAACHVWNEPFRTWYQACKIRSKACKIRSKAESHFRSKACHTWNEARNASHVHESSHTQKKKTRPVTCEMRRVWHGMRRVKYEIMSHMKWGAWHVTCGRVTHFIVIHLISTYPSFMSLGPC